MTAPKLTARIHREIVAFVRAGGYPEVAAEAAGIPRKVFHDWMARSERPRAARRYRELAEAVCQALAQARLTAETEVRAARPLDWLRCGPGRHASAWTSPARAPVPPAEAAPLDHPAVQRIIALALDATQGCPEARQRLAEAFAEQAR
jgi:hypothetical protein